MTMAQIVALAGHYPPDFWRRAAQGRAYTLTPIAWMDGLAKAWGLPPSPGEWSDE